METLKQVNGLFGDCKVLRRMYIPLTGSHLKRIYNECKPSTVPSITTMRNLVEKFGKLHATTEIKSSYDEHYLVISNGEECRIARTTYLLEEALKILPKMNKKTWQQSEKRCDFIIDLATFLRFGAYEEITTCSYFSEEKRKDGERWIRIGFPVLNARFGENPRDQLFRPSFTVASNEENFPSLSPLYQMLQDVHSEAGWERAIKECADMICNL